MAELEDKAVCVDTDVLVDYLRGREPGMSAYKKWRNKTKTVITSISAYELIFGSLLVSRSSEGRSAEARSLIEQHEVLPFDSVAAGFASSIGASLRKSGNEIEIRDLFIASICLAGGIPILTRNKSHYARITGLKVVTV